MTACFWFLFRTTFSRKSLFSFLFLRSFIRPKIELNFHLVNAGYQLFFFFRIWKLEKCVEIKEQIDKWILQQIWYYNAIRWYFTMNISVLFLLFALAAFFVCSLYYYNMTITTFTWKKKLVLLCRTKFTFTNFPLTGIWCVVHTRKIFLFAFTRVKFCLISFYFCL